MLSPDDFEATVRSKFGVDLFMYSANQLKDLGSDNGNVKKFCAKPVYGPVMCSALDESVCARKSYNLGSVNQGISCLGIEADRMKVTECAVMFKDFVENCLPKPVDKSRMDYLDGIQMLGWCNPSDLHVHYLIPDKVYPDFSSNPGFAFDFRNRSDTILQLPGNGIFVEHYYAYTDMRISIFDQICLASYQNNNPDILSTSSMSINMEQLVYVVILPKSVPTSSFVPINECDSFPVCRLQPGQFLRIPAGCKFQISAIASIIRITRPSIIGQTRNALSLYFVILDGIVYT